MNAFGFAMINVCLAFGFFFVSQMGVFQDTEHQHTGDVFTEIAEKFTTPIFTVEDVISFNGITALAIALALSTIVVLHTNLISPQGIAIGIMGGVIYGSLFLNSVIVYEEINYPMVSVCWTVYALIAAIAGLYMLIQMASGGQKMFD